MKEFIVKTYIVGRDDIDAYWAMTLFLDIIAYKLYEYSNNIISPNFKLQTMYVMNYGDILCTRIFTCKTLLIHHLLHIDVMFIF